VLVRAGASIARYTTRSELLRPREIIILAGPAKELTGTFEQVVAVAKSVTDFSIEFDQLLGLVGQRCHRTPAKGGGPSEEPPTMLKRRKPKGRSGTRSKPR
jgi:hypothetical protein